MGDIKRHLFHEDGTGTICDSTIDDKVTRCLDEVITTIGSEYSLAELEAYVMELVLDRFCSARIQNRVNTRKKDSQVM